MGVIVNKKESQDELTRRINADLRAKAVESADVEKDGSDVDLAEDAEYLKDLKKTGRFSWIWIVLVVLAVLSLVVIFGGF
ncbi:hypothetical protein IKD67_03575 [Candidatus Saccharibacteria bacterium]|nr:hypothetical protein [Candidatus Saccharibacteria bacterium]